MKTVRVYGALRKELGQASFSFDVNTCAEALKALLVNFPGLEKFLVDSGKDGVGYRVKVGKEKIVEKNILDLALPWSEADVFSITPVLTGSGRGTGQLLLGVALIGASFLVPGGWMIGTFGGAAIPASQVVAGVGIALALGGVVQMLAPTPDLPQEASKLESFSFSGVTNTSRVGTSIPVAFGRLFVGSSVISSGLDVDQLI